LKERVEKHLLMAKEPPLRKKGHIYQSFMQGNGRSKNVAIVTTNMETKLGLRDGELATKK